MAEEAAYIPKSNGSLLLGHDACVSKAGPGTLRLDALGELSLWWQVPLDDLTRVEGRLCLGTNTPEGVPRAIGAADIAAAEAAGWTAAPRRGGVCVYVSRKRGSVVWSKCLAHENRCAVLVIDDALME